MLLWIKSPNKLDFFFFFGGTLSIGRLVSRPLNHTDSCDIINHELLILSTDWVIKAFETEWKVMFFCGARLLSFPACCAGPVIGQGRMPGRLLNPEVDNEIIIELDESNVISDTLAGLSRQGITSGKIIKKTN